MAPTILLYKEGYYFHIGFAEKWTVFYKQSRFYASFIRFKEHEGVSNLPPISTFNDAWNYPIRASYTRSGCAGIFV